MNGFPRLIRADLGRAPELVALDLLQHAIESAVDALDTAHHLSRPLAQRRGPEPWLAHALIGSAITLADLVAIYRRATSREDPKDEHEDPDCLF